MWDLGDCSHPQPGWRLRAPPNKPTAASGPGGRWGRIVLVLGVGRCAFRPPRVVFVLGLVSLINSLTSGNPTDLKRGREAEERAVRRAARPSHTEMNTRSKRRLEALSRRYPGKLKLHVCPKGPRLSPCVCRRYKPQRGSMTSLRTSSLWGRAAGIAVCTPCGIRPGYGTRGISHPQPGRRLRAPPNKPTAASGPGGRWGV